MRLSERDFAQLQRGKKGKPKGQKETDIRAAIRDYLRWHGWFVVLHYQSPLSHKGFSDLTAIKNGRTVYIEVKTATGTQSEDQLKFQADIEEHGGTYIVARSVDDVKFLCEGCISWEDQRKTR